MEERPEEELSEPKEPPHQESAEGTEEEESVSYTPDELLVLEMDEIDC
ncbi:hypothetical protein A2U01_0067189 [Trifolium medium]|uniref:Uncharacterized protein n=1 Tax=Trifolium medium TaxID=97028 RepID=A0A392SBA9_9FABA|nr:hypothetical protein [Trifolium medium]